MSLGQLLASGAAAVFNPGMFLMVCVAIILGTISVSYTHLDVYKRQAIASSMAFAIASTAA